MATRNANAEGVPTWALYQKSTSSVLKRRQLLPTADQTLPPGLDPDLAWLEEWTDDQPAFDPATQYLKRAVNIVDDRPPTHLFSARKGSEKGWKSQFEPLVVQ